MTGLFVVLIAIYLGAFGPAFRWRGAAMLAVVTVTGGITATIDAASDAAANGLLFVVTPGSVLLGLVEQTLLVLAFYALAALARRSFTGLVGKRAPESEI